MQSKHLCGPVAGAVPQVGMSLTHAFQAPGGLLGLWEAVEQDGVTDHVMVLGGAPTPPQLKAFLTAAGELFPGVYTAGSSLVLSDIPQCSSSFLAPLTTRNHTGTWELPSCSASSWRNCTNQRQAVTGPVREAGPAVGPPGKGVGMSCWRLRGSRQGRC